jgi:pepF/M3 family oligoendopeptidase
MKNGTDTLPQWSLETVYSGFDSDTYTTDKETFRDKLKELTAWVHSFDSRQSNPKEWLHGFLQRYNRAHDLYENLFSFAYCRYSTNTRDEQAGREINHLEEIALPFTEITVVFRNTLANIPELDSLIETDPDLREYGFFLSEQRRLQQKQMSLAEENLAADLSRSGGNAWGRLQESVSSTLTAVWVEATGEKKTVTELRELAHHRDRAVRERAYQLELAAWKHSEIPIAAALNGVKGFSITLNRRRSYTSTLERSLLQSRISEKTLASLLEVMQDALPTFRRYLHAKARFLGLPQLAFFDLFAPLEVEHTSWRFEDAQSFIVETFAHFSDELSRFAEEAFRNNWIDAQPREGKVGGAYCISFPLPGESRVLCNYNNNFDSVSTVAHELGHAYHHHILQDAPAIHRDYPMTLAETASIFCQNLILGSQLDRSSGRQRLVILEEFLKDCTQVIVDILSRFQFEKALLSRRAEAELSPAELCDIMTDVQKNTYGDGLDQNKLHPYMWAVKPHYYSQDLAYYNFPYAFGMLFGLGLYSRYIEEGPSFVEQYESILAQTGKASAEDITGSAGFDIREKAFWQSGMDIIAKNIDEYAELVDQ